MLKATEAGPGDIWLIRDESGRRVGEVSVEVSMPADNVFMRGIEERTKQYLSFGDVVDLVTEADQKEYFNVQAEVSLNATDDGYEIWEVPEVNHYSGVPYSIGRVLPKS